MLKKKLKELEEEAIKMAKEKYSLLRDTNTGSDADKQSNKQ